MLRLASGTGLRYERSIPAWVPASLTQTHWVVWGKIEAFEGDEKVFEKEFDEKIVRMLQ